MDLQHLKQMILRGEITCSVVLKDVIEHFHELPESRFIMIPPPEKNSVCQINKDLEPSSDEINLRALLRDTEPIIVDKTVVEHPASSVYPSETSSAIAKKIESAFKKLLKPPNSENVIFTSKHPVSSKQHTEKPSTMTENIEPRLKPSNFVSSNQHTEISSTMAENTESRFKPPNIVDKFMTHHPKQQTETPSTMAEDIEPSLDPSNIEIDFMGNPQISTIQKKTKVVKGIDKKINKVSSNPNNRKKSNFFEEGLESVIRKFICEPCVIVLSDDEDEIEKTQSQKTVEHSKADKSPLLSNMLRSEKGPNNTEIVTLDSIGEENNDEIKIIEDDEPLFTCLLCNIAYRLEDELKSHETLQHSQHTIASAVSNMCEDSSNRTEILEFTNESSSNEINDDCTIVEEVPVEIQEVVEELPATNDIVLSISQFNDKFKYTDDIIIANPNFEQPIISTRSEPDLSDAQCDIRRYNNEDIQMQPRNQLILSEEITNTLTNHTQVQVSPDMGRYIPESFQRVQIKQVIVPRGITTESLVADESSVQISTQQSYLSDKSGKRTYGPAGKVRISNCNVGVDENIQNKYTIMGKSSDNPYKRLYNQRQRPKYQDPSNNEQEKEINEFNIIETTTNGDPLAFHNNPPTDNPYKVVYYKNQGPRYQIPSNYPEGMENNQFNTFGATENRYPLAFHRESSSDVPYKKECYKRQGPTYQFASNHEERMENNEISSFGTRENGDPLAFHNRATTLSSGDVSENTTTLIVCKPINVLKTQTGKKRGKYKPRMLSVKKTKKQPPLVNNVEPHLPSVSQFDEQIARMIENNSQSRLELATLTPLEGKWLESNKSLVLTDIRKVRKPTKSKKITESWVPKITSVMSMYEEKAEVINPHGEDSVNKVVGGLARIKPADGDDIESALPMSMIMKN